LPDEQTVTSLLQTKFMSADCHFPSLRFGSFLPSLKRSRTSFSGSLSWQRGWGFYKNSGADDVGLQRSMWYHDWSILDFEFPCVLVKLHMVSANLNQCLQYRICVEYNSSFERKNWASGEWRCLFKSTQVSLQRNVTQLNEFNSSDSSIQPFLVGMQTMDASFDLRRGRSLLKLELTAVHHGSCCREALCAHILAAMLQARVEVWHKAVDTPLVRHGTRHPLRYSHSLALHEVTTLTWSVFEGVQWAHTWKKTSQLNNCNLR